mgnify:CR=1 FL=1|jgi:hypothetical protein
MHQKTAGILTQGLAAAGQSTSEVRPDCHSSAEDALPTLSVAPLLKQ